MTNTSDHLRFQRPHLHLQAPFGDDWFGRRAESFARFFGTPRYLLAQTFLVIVWVAMNAIGAFSYDPYPFILLNLLFSTQAAYAAPLILLARTRQADREKAHAEADAHHREEIARMQLELLRQNTDITEQVAQLAARIETLTSEIHGKLVGRTGS